MAQSVYEQITNKVIESMEKGVCPWHQPWQNVLGGNALAISYVSRKPYSFINQLLLEEGEYITMNEIKKIAGAKLKKGSKAHQVFGFFRSFKNKKDGSYTNEEPNEDVKSEFNTIWNMRYFNVFSINDCEGIEPHGTTDAKPLFEHKNDIANAEDVINAYKEREGKNGFAFHNIKSNSAFYSPKDDKVVVPSKGQYKELTEYYSTAFHELAHSTGAESRLARKGVCDFDHFGSHQYSQEELVAELSSAMMLGVLGIDCTKTFNNSVAYLQSWIEKLKNDPKMIVWASSQAEKAVKFILNGKK